MKVITSYSEFSAESQQAGRTFLLLHKNGSEISGCAFKNLETLSSELNGTVLFSADVNTVRDIHTMYGISSVPSLLLFENGELINVIKGCQESSYYKALIRNALFRVETGSEANAAKSVTVYSTPTCSWCNTLKAWLNKKNIRYSDIDVSRDEKAAEAMVRRSGQQGVPQTDINGQMVVGFNQHKLKELLGIQ